MEAAETSRPAVTPAYDILSSALLEQVPVEEYSLHPNAAYEQYLKMHKIIVGQATAGELIRIHNELAGEDMPRYLVSAGWAAVEAALITTHLPTKQRFELLDRGANCWERAVRNQVELNKTEVNHLIEDSAPYRSALDLACLPLIRGIIAGDVTKMTCEDVFKDCLSIAEASALQMELAWREGNMSAFNDHIGFGHECNALLALNRLQSPTWFAIPATARADCGYYYGNQTHDLLAIRQKRGEIQSIIPVEVKSRTSLRDRNRYHALLVRGKMHLTLTGGPYHTPTETLEAISAVDRGLATERQQDVATKVSERFRRMLGDYYVGEYLGEVAVNRVQPFFRDNSLVIERHPGLSTIAQQR